MNEFLNDSQEKIMYVQDKLNYLKIKEINQYLNSALGDILAAQEEIRKLKAKGDDE